jgi:hypothetical protein
MRPRSAREVKGSSEIFSGSLPRQWVAGPLGSAGSPTWNGQPVEMKQLHRARHGLCWQSLQQWHNLGLI